MLKNWSVTDFKSLGGKLNLDLSAINILAGANSSGKSSIIQSILLLKQTLQYGSSNRSIQLNGPLLRLGAFDDVLNNSSDTNTMSIGFEIDLTDGYESSAATAWMRALRRQRSSRDTASLVSARLDLSWRLDGPRSTASDDVLPSHRRINPDLASVCLETTRRSEEGIIKTNVQFVRRKYALPETEDAIPGEESFEVTLDANTLAEISEDKPEARVTGGLLAAFMPYWIIVQFNRAAQRAINVANTLKFLSSDHLPRSSKRGD